MTVYYNEIDPQAAAWLRELIANDLIAAGDVDERDIRDIEPRELLSYDQCHFFAGIGTWSLALRNAGWADDRPVWTGSCPCQPFSAAGRRSGVADERHLWPHWFHLIEVCRPGVVFGEQVASKDGRAWFDLVQADLEGVDYAAGAFDLCAAGFGAPHIRQRLYFAARSERLDDAAGPRHLGALEKPEGHPRDEARVRVFDTGRAVGGLSDAAGQQRDARGIGTACEQSSAVERFTRHGSVARSAEIEGRPAELGGNGRPGPVNGFWRNADWLGCRDGKWRPVEPGTFPLAHGAPARVGRLRGYGNGIVEPQARAFIEAYREVEGA